MGIVKLRLRSSFSDGVKFKSKHKSNLLCLWTWVLCFLMWPPRACPIPNWIPQMGHGCVLLSFKGICEEESKSLGLLWLALCPPRAWKEGNTLLQVLHLKPLSLRLAWEEVELVTPTLDSNIKHLVIFKPSNSPPSLGLFMAAFMRRDRTEAN